MTSSSITHIQKTIEKAEKSYSALSKLMPNIGGPSSEKRKVLCSTVHSILLYGAPVWHQATNILTYSIYYREPKERW